MISDKKKSLFGILLRAVLYTFAAVGVLSILLMALASKVLLPNLKEKVDVEKDTFLLVNFDQNFPELSNKDMLSEIMGGSSVSLYDLLNVFEAAKYDDRISGIVATIDNSGLGAAQIEEIRRAIEKFRQSGKKTYIYSQGFGSLGGGLSEYYLATAFDEIVMQPKSMLGITGVAIEVPFLQKLLKKVGITPEFYARYEYKNAVSSILDSQMSPIYREQMQSMVDEFGNYMSNQIAKERNLDKKELITIINNAPIFAEEAIKKGLIDEIKYKEELFAGLNAKHIISAEDYLSGIYVKPAKDKIAILFLEGIINSGESEAEKLQSDAIIGEDSVLRTIKQIEKDKNIKAVVVRINSPGGSYNAAAEIWFALKNLKEKRNIPLIVSQGDYAASGGYFISLPADYIYAEPLTLTGSIGVFGGKIVVAELMNKINIKWDGVYYGKNAGIDSLNHKFSDAERKIFNNSLDVIYNDFTNKVSEARGIDNQQMDKLARGRVWSGMQAEKNGLIDKIGGLSDALFKAAELAGIESYEPVIFPKNKSFQDRLAEFISGQANISMDKYLAKFGIKTGDIDILFNENTIYTPIKIKM